MTTSNEPGDDEFLQRKEIRGRLEELDVPDDEGHTHRDPETQIKWMVCAQCDQPMELDDHHSGGECNLCHALSKDP